MCLNCLFAHNQDDKNKGHTTIMAGENYRERICCLCFKEDEESMHFCVDCGTQICEACSQTHKQENNDHSIILIEKALRRENYIFFKDQVNKLFERLEKDREEVEKLIDKLEKFLKELKEIYRERIKKNKEIFEFNKQEELERKKKSDYEKVKDKELVDSIVQKEKALDLIDKQEKEKKIKEFQQNKQYLEYVMNQKKEAELWMDKIAQDEADKEYYKEQEKWKKEEAKRIELLKSVYKGREEAVRYKQGLKEVEKEQIKKEREVLDKEILEDLKRKEEISKEEAKRRKEHQNELIYQISEKEAQRRRELQDKLYEERAAQLWEMEYQKKINQQREIHLKKLAEIRNRNGVV